MAAKRKPNFVDAIGHPYITWLTERDQFQFADEAAWKAARRVLRAVATISGQEMLYALRAADRKWLMCMVGPKFDPIAMEGRWPTARLLAFWRVDGSYRAGTYQRLTQAPYLCEKVEAPEP